MSSRGKIALVAAGGQIGMKYNPQAGAWHPTLPAEEMLSWLPPDTGGKIFPVDWSHQPSSHYTIRMTSDLAQLLAKTIVDGGEGVIVTCGTDSLEEMAFLTDLLWAYPQPVIFTASLLPPDARGSDAQVNLYQAALSALSKQCWGLGVLVCLQDQLFAASEIEETANHRRCAFSAPDRGPLGHIIGGSVAILRQPRRSKILEGSFSPARDVEILYATLGGDDRILEILASDQKKGLDGIVIAGFGNGNVPPSWIPHIKRLVKDGITVLVTTRCPQGHTQPLQHAFEGSLSRLLEIGVLQGGNLRPLQARLKLAAGLGAGLRKTELQEYLLDG